MKSQLAGAGAVAAIIAGGILGGATPAFAANAPTCVQAQRTGEDADGYNYVQVYNSCKKAKRVKAIFAWGPDSSCVQMSVGSTWRLSSSRTGRFDGLETC
jgi:hypothetical protein